MEQQIQKPLANTVPPATDRTMTATDIKLHSDDPDYVRKALNRVGDTLEKIRQDNKWTNSTLLEYLDVAYFPGSPTISRLIKHEGKRLPNAAQLFDLRRVFGISLDALADGEDPFTIEQMSTAELAKLMEQISRELVRRLWQQ